MPKTKTTLAEEVLAALRRREASAWSDHTVSIIFRTVEDADALSQLLCFSEGKERADVFEH